jgi:DNA-binding HxlR family transcriptional regulator
MANTTTKINPNANDPNRFVLHKASEALEPQPPIDWIVKPLFSTGTVSLIVGHPGSKKTFSMLDLAVCLASGKPWLGFETRMVPVLIIDEESGSKRINRRLGAIMRGQLADAHIPLDYISLARFDFFSEHNDFDQFEQKILETGAKIIIIDALSDVMPGADENIVKDVQPVFMGLRQVADKTNSAIASIHHLNKKGGYRGSSSLLGAVDVMLMVTSKLESPNIDFEVLKNRDDEPMKFAAVAHFDTNQFWLSSSQFVPKQEFGKPQKYVIRYLYQNGLSSISDIKDHADSCKDTSARKAVYDLVDLGIVRRVDNGGSGEKATYDLTDMGKEKAKTFIKPVTCIPLKGGDTTYTGSGT